MTGHGSLERSPSTTILRARVVAASQPDADASPLPPAGRSDLLNQAMPPRRTFSSSAPVGPPPAAPQTGTPAGPVAPQPRQAWLVAVLAALGGAAAGAAVVLITMVLFGAVPGVSAASSLDEPIDNSLLLTLDGDEPDAAGSPVETPGIVVDVAGAVARPGLQRLRAGDRVGDALEAAGGFAPRADLAAASQSLNLAQPLEDGAKVLVPELGIDRPNSPSTTDSRIDLNRAGQAELESLPGVGPVTARKILEARSERRFGAARDLRSRGLVSESVFEDLRPLVHAG
jgi:DNA uptake protein ComE-like DNA-binding protein